MPNQLSHEEIVVAIVDDDPSVRRSTCRLIGSLGHSVEAFASAEEFLESGRLTKTACLILDVRMPGMDGLELRRVLADRRLAIPTVFITAHAGDEEERQAMRGGAIAFLRKPVDKPTLVRVLDSVLPRSATCGGKRDGH